MKMRIEVPTLCEPVGVLVFRWWRMLLTATSWLSGRILAEVDGPLSREVETYCSRDARTQVFP